MEGDSKSNVSSVFGRRRKFGCRDTHRGKPEAETGGTQPQANNTWGRQKLEEARTLPRGFGSAALPTP